MNFIPFFFLGYLMGRNQRCERSSADVSWVSTDTLTCLLFGMAAGGIAVFGAVLGIPAHWPLELPKLSMQMEVLGVFLPAITVFSTMMAYSLWNDHVGGISKEAGTWSLATGATLTVFAAAMLLTGFAATWSANVWLLVRTFPALSIPLTLIAYDGVIKWRAKRLGHAEVL
jgi:hypothetical protein